MVTADGFEAGDLRGDIRALLDLLVMNNRMNEPLTATLTPGFPDIGYGTTCIHGLPGVVSYLQLPSALSDRRIELIPVPGSLGIVTLILDGGDTLNGGAQTNWKMNGNIIAPLIPLVLAAENGNWLSNLNPDIPFDFASVGPSVPGGVDWLPEWNTYSPTDVEFTSLTDAGELFIFDAPTVTSISCSVLTDVLVPGISMYNCPSLTAVVLQALVNCDAIQFTSGTAALTVFTLGSGVLKSVTGDVVLTSCALDQDSVNNLLIALAALDGTNGTTPYTGRTVAITGTSAAPAGAGATAKATLITAGNGVTTN